MTDLVAARIDRDVVRVHGPDTWSFLHGQLSQDVQALQDGDSAWSFLLQPDGKLGSWLRVTRRSDQEALLDVDGGFGEAVIARLERFKLRIDCALEALDWSAVAVRGPGAEAVAANGAEVVADAGWPGTEGVDFFGPEVAVPDGVTEVGRDGYDALRIRAGVPAMGAELTDGLIPAESGVVERSVSFTKGCFTGQELVARIDSRGGNAPRHLRSVVADSGELPAPGADLLVDGQAAGTLTSAVGGEGLAYVKRSVEPPATGEVGGATVSIASLPA